MSGSGHQPQGSEDVSGAGRPQDGAQVPAAAGVPAGVPHPRSVRSYVMRAGRTTEGQARAIETLGPRFLVPYEPGRLLDPVALFGRSAPTILEIGFGMGEATAEIAARRPEDDFIGCEVHEPGVGALLKRIGERGLSNVRIIRHDAVEVLEQMVAPGSLAGVHIFFPDPWHKKRHHKRRLIQPPSSHSWRAAWRRAATSTARPIGSPMPNRCSTYCRPSRCSRTRPRATRPARSTVPSPSSRTGA